MTNEQDAVQADDQPKAGSEGEDAQNLDSLLKEFEEEPTPQKTEDKPLTADDLKEIKNLLKEEMQVREKEREAKIRESTQNSIKETIKNIKGDLKVPDDLVEGLLYSRAAKNPAFTKAFTNRGKNPDAWAKVEKEISKELKKTLEGLGDKSSENKKRIMDAVRNVKTETPSAENLGGLSNRDFEAKKKEIFSQYR